MTPVQCSAECFATSAAAGSPGKKETHLALLRSRLRSLREFSWFMYNGNLTLSNVSDQAQPEVSLSLFTLFTLGHGLVYAGSRKGSRQPWFTVNFFYLFSPLPEITRASRKEISDCQLRAQNCHFWRQSGPKLW